MGEYVNFDGLRSFEPDDDENTLYICAQCRVDLRTVIDRCKKKWPNAAFSDIELTSEHIHTDCIGYDRYDPMDYTNYIVATYNGKAK